MATDTRVNRDLVSREKSVRYEYKPAAHLPDPTPIPGVSFRWIMTSLMGKDEPTNVSRKMREGWEPVKAADHPELMLTGDKNGNVEIGGLMLCRMPTERLEAMMDYYNRQNQSQMESVDNNFLRQQDPRMPLFSDRKSTSTRGSAFGSGSK